MKKLIFIAGFYSLLSYACNNTADKSNTASDSAAAKSVIVDSAALTKTGIYGGFIPCPDCRGISTFLLLNADMTYRIEETHYMKEDKFSQSGGNWKMENGKIYLYENNTEKLSFISDEEKLWQLDVQGNRISGNMGNKFVLNKQQMADKQRLKDKSDAGIDFIGHGNEPFWSLEIDKGKNIIFNSPNMSKPDTMAYTEPAVSGNLRKYHVQTEKTKLDVRLSSRFCSDGMSDFLYEYKVSLEYNGKSYSGCGLVLTAL